MAKFCIFCGTQLPDNAVFCSQCGKRVQPETTPEGRLVIPAPPEAVVTISDEPSVMPEEPKATPRQRKKAAPAPAAEENEQIEPLVIPAPPGTAVTISDEPPVMPDGPKAAPKRRKKTEPAPTAEVNEQIDPLVIPAPPGARVTISNEPPKVPQRPGSASRRKEKSSSSTKSKNSGCFVNLILIFVMVAELVVAGFKYPGILKTEEKDRVYYMKTPVPTRIVNAASTAVPAITDEDDMDPVYTPAQIASAPTISVPVSGDNPVAEAGAVKVDLRSWNLDNDSDMLTVKDLPVISGSDSGKIIKGYEFSLASGQTEFATHVTITIPRTDSNSPGICVWFNEKTGEWEPVYDDNFIPKPMGCDVVFRCSVYHYLMMGAPEKIIFTDPFAKDYEKAPRVEGSFTIPDIPAPALNSKTGKYESVKKVDVNVVIPIEENKYEDSGRYDIYGYVRADGFPLVDDFNFRYDKICESASAVIKPDGSIHVTGNGGAEVDRGTYKGNMTASFTMEGKINSSDKEGTCKISGSGTIELVNPVSDAMNLSGTKSGTTTFSGEDVLRSYKLTDGSSPAPFNEWKSLYCIMEGPVSVKGNWTRGPEQSGVYDKTGTGKLGITIKMR